MTGNRPKLRLWLTGVVIFAVVVVLGIWLEAEATVGIVDHQLAGDAATVDAIQGQWRDEGVLWLAIVSMLLDLVFIGVYVVGVWIAGRSFIAIGSRVVRILGWIVCVAAAVFGFTDYSETILQVIQLLRRAGSDGMAVTAAAMQTVKVASFVVSFAGVIAALAVRRLTRSPA